MANTPWRKEKSMRKDVQPKTRLVVFQDSQTDKQFLIESTISTKDTVVYQGDGKEYPVVKVEVSSDTHPFYTGQQTFIQAAGRVDRFNKRYQRGQHAVEKPAVEEVKEEAPAESETQED
jgi:large subunit ribosomal protein L31